MSSFTVVHLFNVSSQLCHRFAGWSFTQHALILLQAFSRGPSLCRIRYHSNIRYSIHFLSYTSIRVYRSCTHQQPAPPSSRSTKSPVSTAPCAAGNTKRRRRARIVPAVGFIFSESCFTSGRPSPGTSPSAFRALALSIQLVVQTTPCGGRTPKTPRSDAVSTSFRRTR